MFKPLKRFGSSGNDIAVLLVGPAHFCIRLADALHEQKQKLGCTYQLQVHKSERISDVIKESNIHLNIDFIAFLLDTSIGTCLQNMEYDLQLLDTTFFVGRICFINGNCNLGIKNMSVSYEDLWSMKMIYGVELLKGDIRDDENCSHLAGQLLKLVEYAVGVKSGIPCLGPLSSFNV